MPSKLSIRGNFIFAALTLGTAGFVSIIAAFATGYMLALIGNKTLAYISFIMFFFSGVACFYILSRITKKLKNKYSQTTQAKIEATVN